MHLFSGGVQNQYFSCSQCTGMLEEILTHLPNHQTLQKEPHHIYQYILFLIRERLEFKRYPYLR